MAPKSSRSNAKTPAKHLSARESATHETSGQTSNAEQTAKSLPTSKSANPRTDSQAAGSNEPQTNTLSSSRTTGKRNAAKMTAEREPSVDWDEMEESAKRRKIVEDDEERRRDPITHLLSSIYADIEAAAEIQQRRDGVAGETLTEEEMENFQKREDLRLDHLRELRLMSVEKNLMRNFKKASLPRGKRYDPLRVLREIVYETPSSRKNQLCEAVSSLGWPLVTICLHSKNFCEVLELTNAAKQTRKLNAIKEEGAGYQFFAGSRSFRWLDSTLEQREQDALFRSLDFMYSNQNVSESLEDAEEEARLDVLSDIVGFPDDQTAIRHPHEWKLSHNGHEAIRLDVSTGTGTGSQIQPQENIAESKILLDAAGWGNKAQWLIQDDPRYRTHEDDNCEACGKQGEGEGSSFSADCQCSLDRVKLRLAAQGKYQGNRVCLRDIQVGMGTGVRALQCFPAGSMLAEYVGEIYPSSVGHEKGGKYHNRTYHFRQDRKSVKGACKVSMFIDPAVKGNWTRYINHSCRANTMFSLIICGNKQLVVVHVGERPIAFGEEITIDYGRDYFTGQHLACLCGARECKLWNADKVKDNKQTLGGAKEKDNEQTLGGSKKKNNKQTVGGAKKKGGAPGRATASHKGGKSK